ncbi:MAG TPA: ATP-binding protein, partial [Dehalococcoidia bacterium]|nr:ATP-binding protein [Dehalococcoidia bacterium]
VINLQLEAAEKLGEAQARRAFEQVRHARRLTLDCLREVRRSVGALRATTLEELSLERALTKLVADFSDSTGIAVSLELNLSDGLEPAADARLALYRVAQEGLTNVQRHAHATSVRLALSAADGSASIVVDDDGRGPVAEVQPETSGFGLLGLRERVELLGGRLSFSRRASGGSELAATLPLHGPA